VEEASPFESAKHLFKAIDRKLTGFRGISKGERWGAALAEYAYGNTKMLRNGEMVERQFVHSINAALSDYRVDPSAAPEEPLD